MSCLTTSTTSLRAHRGDLDVSIDMLRLAWPGFEVERDVDEARANVYEHTDPSSQKTPVRNDRIRDLLPGFPAHDPSAALEDFLDRFLLRGGIRRNLSAAIRRR